jgi:hypothetical protein
VSRSPSDADTAWVHQLPGLVLAGLEARNGAKVRDLGPLVVEVAAFLVEHPEASANDAVRQVRGSRSDILWAVRELRGRSRRFSTPQNHSSANGPDTSSHEGVRAGTSPPGGAA